MIYLPIALFLIIFMYLLIFRYKVPWLPIWQTDLVRLEKLLRLESGKVFYDLGSGNGRVIFYLAKKYPDVEFVGFELSFFLCLFSQIRKVLGRHKNVKIKLRDYMRLDLNLADYIYVFANEDPMQEIGEKIDKEVEKEIVLISYCFQIDKWEKFLITKSKPDDKINGIYIYQKSSE